MVNGQVIVHWGSVWEPRKPLLYPITNETVSFEIELPDEYKWAHETSVTDGEEFRVFAEFVNSTGSRKESKELVPEKV